VKHIDQETNKGEKMGMYTEMLLTCDLKSDTRKDIVEWFEAMVDTEKSLDDVQSIVPNEMAQSRFNSGLLCGSYYFYGEPFMSFRYDEISNTYHLTVLTNLKNYDSEITRLLNMLTPYIVAYAEDMLGYIRYETNKLPTILSWTGKEISHKVC
jgi:uncharacterized membrane protein